VPSDYRYPWYYVLSGRSSFVVVVKATDLRNLDDFSGFDVLDYARLRQSMSSERCVRQWW
jgi:hypothetical protein